MSYEASWRRSVDDPESFWGEQARLIHWDTPPRQILDHSQPPFRRWSSVAPPTSVTTRSIVTSMSVATS